MIEVTPPYGMNLVFAFAFDRPPPEFERVLKLHKVDPLDPRLAIIEGLIAEPKGGQSRGAADARGAVGSVLGANRNRDAGSK